MKNFIIYKNDNNIFDIKSFIRDLSLMSNSVLLYFLSNVFCNLYFLLQVRQMMYSTHYSHPQHHSHQLFGTSASQYPSHSPYITPHPAPSPSPSSHHHPYGVSLSPTLSHSPTHHIPSSPGPPYAPQHHSVR